MHEIFNMLLAVFDRAALMLICLFFLIRIRLFRELLHKSAHSPKELLAVTAIFSLFALFSTWSGVPLLYHQHSGWLYIGLDQPENPQSTALARRYSRRHVV